MIDLQDRRILSVDHEYEYHPGDTAFFGVGAFVRHHWNRFGWDAHRSVKLGLIENNNRMQLLSTVRLST